MKLTAITPAQPQGLYREKLDSGLSARTVQYIHVTLHKALKQGTLWRLVSSNVAEIVEPPHLPKEEVRPLTEKQTKVFLEEIRGDRLEPLYLLAVSAGMRQGELRGLQWEDIDLKNKVLQVKRILSMTKKGIIFAPPKSAKGCRSISLSNPAIDAKKAQDSSDRRGQKALQLMGGSRVGLS